MWETVSLPGSPDVMFWVWFKPAHFPQGLVLRIPETAFRNDPQQGDLTLRRLLTAVGVDAALVVSCSLYGVPYDGLQGRAPVFDHALPPPPPGADPNIVVQVAAAPPPPSIPPVPATATVPMAGVPTSAAGNVAAIFERIEADWQASLQIERQVMLLRRQLADMLQRLNSLNRDLTPEERLHADRKDRSDWQAARRWLRDLSTRLSRCIKDQDIGDTSIAGRKKWFEETYEQLIVPRRPFEGLQQMQREFESYRKMQQSLLSNMNSVHSSAQQNGERRARQILTRIAAAVRSNRTARGR